MQWSDARIRAVAREAANIMLERGAIDPKAGRNDLITFVEKAISADQEQEGQIDEEARKFLTTLKHLPPPGTGEYQGAFVKAKQVIARKKGFVL